MRYGEYFEGGMGADAIKSLIDRIDFDEEEIKLRDAIDHERGPKPPLGAASPEGDQAPEDRRRRSTGATTTVVVPTIRRR